MKRAGRAFLACALVSWLGFAQDSHITADLRTEYVSAKEALLLVRAIVKIRGRMEVVDEHTVRVTDIAEKIAAARIVIEAVNHPDALTDKIPTRPLGDGSVIACACLVHATVSEVMAALRKEVNIATVAVSLDLSILVVRDTPAQVTAALSLIRRMEMASVPEGHLS